MVGPGAALTAGYSSSAETILTDRVKFRQTQECLAPDHVLVCKPVIQEAAGARPVIRQSTWCLQICVCTTWLCVEGRLRARSTMGKKMKAVYEEYEDMEGRYFVFLMSFIRFSGDYTSARCRHCTKIISKGPAGSLKKNLTTLGMVSHLNAMHPEAGISQGASEGPKKGNMRDLSLLNLHTLEL